MDKKSRNEFFSTLKERFEKNIHRHKGISWDAVQARLEANAKKLQVLFEMESTGGEPDVVASDDKTGEFDLKTSSWISTPADIRKRGGAIFCDRRYDQVFLYHNGADSYYAARGFRGCLKV